MYYLRCIQLLFETQPFYNPKDVLMKYNFENPAPAAGKMLFKLTMIGCLLLACVYGFLVLFNTALAALK
jgi:hypothetical protein